MNRTKYLVTNTAILFISSFSSRLLVFFLLPLYTSVLSLADYGISDILTTTVHLLYIFLTLQISHGIVRFTMDKATDSNEMLGIGLAFTAASSLVVAGASAMARWLDVFPLMNRYYVYLVLIYLFYCLSRVFNGFAKGREKIRLIGICGIATTAVRVSLNILLLVVIPLGLRGFLTATVLSYVASCTFLVAGGVLKDTKWVLPSRSVFIKTLKYTAPIAATEVGWLICTSSDKYIVSWLLGPDATGIISAAHRLPTILTAFTSIFIQAWTLSAIKEADSNDKARYYSRMFDYYNAFAMSAGAVLILSAKLIGSFLFRGEFTVAWIYTPIYLTALVINTMSSFSGSIISAGTDTRPLFTSTGTGAVVNIVLDILLIKWWGIYGAGIATALSYVLIGTMRMRSVKKIMALTIDYGRMVPSIALLCALTCTMIGGTSGWWLAASVLIACTILFINRHRLFDIATMVPKALAGRKKKARKA
jgi:O-antigen/teichoic acid export membrane protein